MTTLAQISLRAQRLADMENSLFIGTDELTTMVNASYTELYDLVLDADQDFFIANSSFTLTTGDNGIYALPATVYKIRGLDILIGSEYLPLKPFQWIERNRRSQPYLRRLGRAELLYRLVGGNIMFDPQDQAAGTYKLWYVPALTLLSTSSDALDTWVTRAGWEDYIAIDCAIKMKEKQDLDTAGLERAKARMTQRIVAASANRNLGDGMRVSDNSESLGVDDGFFWGRW